MGFGRGLRSTFFQPLLEDLAHERVERHLPVRVALPTADDHEPLACGHADVVDIERDELRQTQPGVEQQDHDCAVPCRRTLRHPQQATLLLLGDRPRRTLGQLLAADDRAAETELRVERVEPSEREVHRRRLPPLYRLQMPLVVADRPIPRIGVGEGIAVDG
jgi:hypothetical protein